MASNGAVVVGYPPERIVKAVTFDPREVIERVGEFAPEALIAVEEIGRGYRTTGEFPGGDLTGEMIIEDVEQLSSRPVTRVIVRDPLRSDAEFIELAEQLGLHGVTYFVGWSAWLDIAPAGVTKASGLADVVAELGLDAGRRAGHRRRPQRRRDAALGRSRSGDGSGARPRCRPPPTPSPAPSTTAVRSPNSAAGSAECASRASTLSPEVSSRCWSRSWAASSTCLCRHSEAR